MFNNMLNGKDWWPPPQTVTSVSSGQQSAVFDLLREEQQETGVKVCRGLTFGGRIKRNLVLTIDRQRGNSHMWFIRVNETLLLGDGATLSQHWMGDITEVTLDHCHGQAACQRSRQKTSDRHSVTGQIHQHHQYNADNGLTGHRFVCFTKEPRHLTFQCIFF